MKRHELSLICALAKLTRKRGKCCCRKPRRVWPVFRLALGPFVVNFRGNFTMLLPDDKIVSASVTYTDAKGHPAKVDGVPVWASDNTDVATVAASEDGMSATISPGSSLGTAQISVTADADLGEGTREVIGIGTVEVVAGEAVAAVLSFGEPTAP
jgi:hypothetical protein